MPSLPGWPMWDVPMLAHTSHERSWNLATDGQVNTRNMPHRDPARTALKASRLKSS